MKGHKLRKERKDDVAPFVALVFSLESGLHVTHTHTHQLFGYNLHPGAQRQEEKTFGSSEIALSPKKESLLR